MLKRVLKKDRKSKPSLRWTGLFGITECLDEYILRFEHLFWKNKQLLHGRRLKFLRKSDLEITEELQEHLEYQVNELLVIQEFQDNLSRSELPKYM